LESHETVKPGDEFLNCLGVWELTQVGRKSYTAGFVGFKYRRPVTPSDVFVPQWRHTDNPGCPVHVLWAESPSSVKTVAKPKRGPVQPGTGYRLLKETETVAFGDEWYNPGLNSQRDWCPATGSVGKLASHMGFTFRRKVEVPGDGYVLVQRGDYILLGDEWLMADGTWKATELPHGSCKHFSRTDTLRRKIKAPSFPKCPHPVPAGYFLLDADTRWQEGDLICSMDDDEWVKVADINYGTTSRTWKRTTDPRWVCRPIPQPKPEYMPYANAAEAAAGLQGKLIVQVSCTRNPGNYYPVNLVTPKAVRIESNMWAFAGLLEHWQFTDGTPCGVLVIQEKGTK